MISLHTTQFDDAFQNSTPHFKRYPQLLPFIGNRYLDTKSRILLMGESHYIPSADLLHESKTKTHLTDWYNNDSLSFSNYLTNYINTRHVVTLADHAHEVGHKKPLLIYYNIKAALKERYLELQNTKCVFPLFSYYNYFQRPAFTEKASIINNPADDAFAYQTLQQIIGIIKPRVIIFGSRKAFNSFSRSKAKEQQQQLFSEISIGQVPHPSCAWWNKTSRSCGGMTGKQKFLKLIETCDL